MSTATTTAAKSDPEHERRLAAFKAKEFREKAEQTYKLRGKRTPKSMLETAAEKLEAAHGLEPQIPANAPKAPAKTATASKPSTLASVLPLVKSATDLRIDAVKAELAAKEAELAANRAKLRADMMAKHPAKDHAFIDGWLTNAGNCQAEFCGDFRAFAAYRRNAG